MRLREERDGVLRETFLTWGDMLAYCEQRLATRGWHTSATNGGGLAPAIELARSGWSEGERMASELAHKLEANLAPSIMREDWGYDVEGNTFDVARYVEGEPEHWIRVEDSQHAAGNRHIKLTLNCSVVACTGDASITRRGAAAVALCHLLEYSGRQVEVWVINAVKSGNTPRERQLPEYIMSCRVKEYDQPLDLGRVAFALAHPDMLRRLAWAIKDQVPQAWQARVGHDGSYGASRDPVDITGVYIGSRDGAWPDAATAEAWVLAELERQGVRIRRN